MTSGPLLLKATGSVASCNPMRFKMLVFRGDNSTAGYMPAVLHMTRENGSRTLSMRGRLHGLEGGRALTVSCVTHRDASGDPVAFGDLLRVEWNRATNAVTGIFTPPSAAALVSGIHARLSATDDETVRATLRDEAARIGSEYGAQAVGRVTFVGQGFARIAKEAAHGCVELKP